MLALDFANDSGNRGVINVAAVDEAIVLCVGQISEAIEGFWVFIAGNPPPLTGSRERLNLIILC